MAKAKELVIVESPSKAKTIEKYLGSDYRVTASMGHLRDLPKSELGVDIEHGFAPKYIAVKEKKELIDELKAASQKAPVVYLATDPDREGEAISWHLKELLNLPDEKAKRVTFNEITKKVVTDSIQHPRSIDQDLVDAQQARRILDRIVGYEISPLLWKKVKRGLSAGRVQSVATRMVVDREEEIRRFESREYWLLDAFLKRSPDEDSFRARFYGVDGKKRELNTEDEVKEEIQNRLQQAATTTEETEGVVKEGDTVVIDFVGRIDGKEFEGGSAGQLRCGILPAEAACIQDEGRRPGRPRGDPPDRCDPYTRAGEEGPHPGTVSPLPHHLGALYGLPDGKRCL